MTPASVAEDYFSKELQAHSTHDACYGHRFARPRSTKAVLGSIVERPKRIHATLLGARATYVRLGHALSEVFLLRADYRRANTRPRAQFLPHRNNKCLLALCVCGGCMVTITDSARVRPHDSFRTIVNRIAPVLCSSYSFARSSWLQSASDAPVSSSIAALALCYCRPILGARNFSSSIS